MSYRRNKRFLLVPYLVCAVLFSASCSGSADREKLLRILNTRSYEELAKQDVRPETVSRSLGKNSLYFVGLHCMEAGLIEPAADLFEAAKKNGEPFTRLACLRLTEIGSESKRLAAAEKFFKQYPADPQARLALAGRLYDAGKYDKALAAAGTNPLADYPEEYRDSLERVRVLSLLQRLDPSFIGEVSRWFSQFDMTAAHRSFYQDFSDYPLAQKARETYGEDFEKLQTLLRFRYAVYAERNYAKAYVLLTQTASALESLSAPLLSDAGKACVFGGKSPAADAPRFEAAAQNMPSGLARFIAWFYAGRLYERAGNYASSLECFISAMQAAPEGANYDNALWYYLDTTAKQSASGIVPALETYASTWHDPYYFDDFLDSASSQLLNRGMWDDFMSASRAAIPYAGAETAAKYAYIAARLLEENLPRSGAVGKNRQAEIHDLLNSAYAGDHVSLYYRFLAAERLSVPLEDLSAGLLSRKTADAPMPDPVLETLLRGYAEYGLPERIYPEFSKNPRGITTKAAAELAAKTASYAPENPFLYSQALRIMATAAAYADVPLTREILELLYPRPYLSEIEDAARRFENPPYLLYGLVRSESFFDKDVVSHAGAIGLAQLMKPTAADIAGRLRMRDYDLLDPLTNVTFGSWYLSNMLSRLDGSPILALFAYNGGLTRVRSWVKDSPGLPRDLFLETLPFRETREYGRKVLSAAAIYGYLYYGKSPREIVREIMR